jgi:hypothetical protein
MSAATQEWRGEPERPDIEQVRVNLEREHDRHPGADAALAALGQGGTVQLSPGHPLAATSSEDAERRWADLNAKRARFQAVLQAGRSPEELGMRPAGEATRRILAERGRPTE